MSKTPRFIIRFANPIILFALLLSVAGGYLASHLRLQSDLATLLPDSFPSVKALNRIQDEVGGIGNLRIVLTSQDYSGLKRCSEAIAAELLKSEYVKYVDFKNDVAFYRKNALLFLEVDELDSLYEALRQKIADEKQRLNPLFVDDLFGDQEDVSNDSFAQWEEKYQDREPKEYYTNEDSTVLVIKVYASESNTSLSYIGEMFEATRKMVDSVRPTDFAKDIEIYYGGNVKNRLDEYEVIFNDILGTAYYGFGGVILLIILYFRRFLGAFLIIFSLLCSLTWTFGLTYLVVGNLNTITGFLFVILFGLGIDYGIHAFARYAESRREGLAFEDAIAVLVTQTGRALTTTAVTTSAAFFSLTVMEFKGFSDLGFISGVGILFALFAMVILLPALITFCERRRWLRLPVADTSPAKRTNANFRRAKEILFAGGLVTLLAVLMAPKVEFEYDFTNLRAVTEERKFVGEKTQGVFDLSESPAVILAESKQEINEIVDAVRQIMRDDSLSPTIDAVRSIYSLVPDDQTARLEQVARIRTLVDEEADGVLQGEDKRRLDEFRKYLQVSEPFTWDEFPEKDKRQFINKRGEIGDFVFIYPAVALRDGKNAISFRDDVGTIKTASGKTYHASSSNIILADMLTIMISEGRWAIVLALTVVFITVFLDFRNLRATLLVLSPLVLGVIWTVGLMFLLGLKWNLFNIVVIPSVIGIGVDNGVHIYHRYSEEGPGSLTRVLKSTGMAVSMTTLTTLVGYSGLIMAHHPGLNSIGDLALIGISLTFVTAVLLLPATLRFIEARSGLPN